MGRQKANRRGFLLLLAGAAAFPVRAVAGSATSANGAPNGVPRAGLHGPSPAVPIAVPHPDPRPGIDARLVLTRDQLGQLPDSVKDVYDLVREIPQIADGLGCNCGCSSLPDYRSLLTCFYENRMAVGCNICQGEARLAHRRFKQGQSLAQIRRAIDARFG